MYDAESNAAGFHFENIEKDGMGPESLQTFVRACLGEEGCWRGCDPALGHMTVKVINALYKSAKSKMLEIV